jgi:transposase
MDRQEAERIYDAGREAVIETLLSLDARVRELEQIVAGLTKNSSNSSRPPSSDPPWSKKEPSRKKPSKRKQGGQPGHKGKKRELLPPEMVTTTHDLFPETCSCCQRPITQELKIPSPNPLRHQVTDLPIIVPKTTEYRCHSVLCSCGHRTVATLPGEVAQSEFGPGVHAVIAYLMAAHRVTRRGIAEIMGAIFGISISTGAVCNVAERVSVASIPVVGVIKRYIASAPALNIDETGWKNKGKRCYLWAFVALRAVFFLISPSRGAKVLKEVLGEHFAGIITSDDHSAYNSYHKNGIRQLCWPHLIRKLKALKDDRSSPHAYCFARNMLKEAGAIFTLWHAFKTSGGSREQLWEKTLPIQERIHDYCVIFLYSKDALVRTRAKKTLANWDHLFTFLIYEGVDPTNNRAEQILRPAVQWRKICFGSQSNNGMRFTERLSTVIGTCRINGINPFHFIVDMVSASFSGKHTIPTLPLILPN